MNIKSCTLSVIILTILTSMVIFSGCSTGNGEHTTPPLPSARQTLSFDHNGASLNYASLDVSVVVPPEAVTEGDVVPLTVQVQPQNLPERCYSDTIYERVGWLGLYNTGDPDILLLDEMAVMFPLNEERESNDNFTLGYFNPSEGIWINSGRRATITDDRMHASFTASAFGAWGIFKSVPLTVDVKASRTSAPAPASISLEAIIDGGSPPYSVIWWFGDDSDPESGVAVAHLYEGPINYVATAIVVDSKNRQVSDDITLFIH